MKSVLNVIITHILLLDLFECGQIQIKPFKDSYGRVSGNLNEQFILTCLSSGSFETKPKSLQWKSSNNIELKTNTLERIHLVENGDFLVLWFSELKPEDSGIYTCSAEVGDQLVEEKIELVLYKRISFLDTPAHQYVRAGERESLIKCITEGNPGPDITWKRNKIELKNDLKYTKTNDGLLIRSIQTEDAGEYECVAMVQSTGEVKSIKIQVGVMTLPKWKHKLTDLEGERGKPIELKCETYGVPQPKVEFRREGIRLAGERYIMNDDKVIIRQLDLTDEGTYTCIASNEAGEIVANFRLNILIGPVLAPIDPVYSLENERATITCDVLEANPPPTFKWILSDTRQEVNLSDPRIRVTSNEHSSKLLIENIRRTDRRNYTCVAANRASFAERSGILLVKFKPIFINDREALDRYYSWIIQDTSSTITRGQSVVLVCKSQGYPQVSVKWSFNRVPIGGTDNPKYKILYTDDGISRLEVVPRDLSDFGAYQCDADNSQGKSTRDILLIQAQVPKLTPQYEIINLKPNSLTLLIQPLKNTDDNLPIESILIQWIVTSGAAIDWSKSNKKEIPFRLGSNDLLRVELDTLVPDTEYAIRLAAVNRVGVGQWSSLTQTRTQKIRQPDPVRLVGNKNECNFINKCLIEWTNSDSNGGSQVIDYLLRWRRVYYKDVDAKYIEKVDVWSPTITLPNTQFRYEINNLSSNSFYEIEIRARNSMGLSAVVPERIKTLPSQLDAQSFTSKTIFGLNLIGFIVGLCVVVSIFVLIMLDMICFMTLKRGLLMNIKKCCTKTQSKSCNKSPSQHSTYVQISQID